MNPSWNTRRFVLQNVLELGLWRHPELRSSSEKDSLGSRSRSEAASFASGSDFFSDVSRLRKANSAFSSLQFRAFQSFEIHFHFPISAGDSSPLCDDWDSKDVEGDKSGFDREPLESWSFPVCCHTPRRVERGMSFALGAPRATDYTNWRKRVASQGWRGGVSKGTYYSPRSQLVPNCRLASLSYVSSREGSIFAPSAETSTTPYRFSLIQKALPTECKERCIKPYNRSSAFSLSFLHQYMLPGPYSWVSFVPLGLRIRQLRTCSHSIGCWKVVR